MKKIYFALPALLLLLGCHEETPKKITPAPNF